jgi:pyruvate/2-oxoglutarate dehydrogenase complex dihydrolipoamide dehydrogenase (E3) component
VIQQARKLVQEQKLGLEQWFQDQANLTLIRGHARLEGRVPAPGGQNEREDFRVVVTGVTGAPGISGATRLTGFGEQVLTGERVILDTGTRSFVPKIEGLDPSDVLDAENWLELAELPPKIAFLGSGYIGLEMGQFYRRMGSEVILLETKSRIMANEDLDVSSAVLGFLQSEGVQFKLETQLKKVEGRRGKYRLILNTGELEVTHLFVATGRQANTDDLGLKSVGLEARTNGYLECDSKLATKVKGLWVAGDLRGGPLFTHTAWDDFRILRSQFLEDGHRSLNRIVPYAVFIDPELGRVGVNVHQAREQANKTGTKFTVVSYPFSKSQKAKEIRETRGFIKLVIDTGSSQIMGAAVLGPSAGELVHLYGTVMHAKLPYSVIQEEIMIHPTLAEAIQIAVFEIPKQQARQIKKTA